MKTNDTILAELNDVIQYFINHKDNEPKTEFCNNVDKLINLQADLANDDETCDDKCHIQRVSNCKTMKFSEGCKVKVIDCIHGHGFEIGEIVEIYEVRKEDYYAKSDNADWYIQDCEIEAVP